MTSNQLVYRKLWLTITELRLAGMLPVNWNRFKENFAMKTFEQVRFFFVCNAMTLNSEFIYDECQLQRRTN